MNGVRLKQTIGMAFLNCGLAALLAPVGRFFLRLGYTIQFANWYRGNSVKSQLLPTENTFGYGNRYALYEHIVNAHNLEQEMLTYLEFGVASGSSIKWWVEKNKNTGSRFIGFDTFNGLPEDWGNITKGTFSTGGSVPDIKDARVSYQVGLFQQTLPGFIASTNIAETRSVIHIDCDLYSASLYVLMTLFPFIKAGDILLFDEFADVMHEYRAYCDSIAANKVNLTIIKAVNGGHKIAFMVGGR